MSTVTIPSPIHREPALLGQTAQSDTVQFQVLSEISQKSAPSRPSFCPVMRRIAFVPPPRSQEPDVGERVLTNSVTFKTL